jgi:predicted nucleic acid-binding protein
MLLDTMFIIYLLRNDAATTKKLKEIEAANIPLYTTTVTVFELWQ